MFDSSLVGQNLSQFFVQFENQVTINTFCPGKEIISIQNSAKISYQSVTCNFFKGFFFGLYKIIFFHHQWAALQRSAREFLESSLVIISIQTDLNQTPQNECFSVTSAKLPKLQLHLKYQKRNSIYQDCLLNSLFLRTLKI